MIPKKPKLTEDQFLRGAEKKRPARGTSGTNGSNNGALRPRLPEKLVERLRNLAGDRRMAVNALIVELLEAAVKGSKGRKKLVS